MSVLKNFLEYNGIEVKPRDSYNYKTGKREPGSGPAVIHARMYAQIEGLLNDKLDLEIKDAVMIRGIQGAFAVRLRSADQFLYCTFERYIDGSVKIERVGTAQYYIELVKAIKANAARIDHTPEVETSEEFETKFPLLIMQRDQ